MSLLFWLVILAIVYIVTFKDDFTKDHIEKASPFLMLVALIVLVFGILNSL